MTHQNSIQSSAAVIRSPHQSARLSIAGRLRGMIGVKRAVLSARQWRARAIDRMLNISTPYPHPQQYRLDTRFADAVPNEPVDYMLLRKFIKPLTISPHDVVFDVGCGMGRLLCVMARKPLRKCVGIEFDPELSAIATRNAARLRRRRAEIEIRCEDAVTADYSGGTIYWFFNPFGAQTLEAVMKQIERSVVLSPRLIQLVYVNPVHAEVINQFAWLEQVGTKHSPCFSSFGASYWRTTGWKPGIEQTSQAQSRNFARLQGETVTP